MTEMNLVQFRDSGMLAEVNRRVLHPLGVALAVDLGTEFTAPSLVVLDNRDDREGWRFDPDDEDLRAKIANVRRLEDERRADRVVALGYFVQPIDGAP